MFRNLLQNKNLPKALTASILLVFLCAVFAAPFAYALEPLQTAANSGGAAKKLLTGAIDGGAAVVLVYVILYAIQTVLQQLVVIFGNILNLLFSANTATSFLTSPFIVNGWEIMRDLANALFILILLWIAFTIIFNLENLGGRKFLIRIVTIALLVNFSFTLVSLAFGFANSLAVPFQKAIGTDPGGLIVGKLQLQGTLAALDTKTAQDLENKVAGVEQQQKIEEHVKELKEGGFTSLPDYLIPTAQAEPLTILGISLGAATIFSVVKALLAGTAALTVTYFAWGGIINMSVNSFFLLIVAFAMATACIVLIFRLVAMVFLVVLAPAAFLAYAVPGGQIQQYFHKWVSQLLRWAFYLPAFYFLLWVAFRFLDTVTNEKGEIIGLPSIPQFSVNLPAMFILMIFVGMLYASIVLARQMGITVADGFINWGKKLGKGAVTGAAGFAGGLAAGVVMPRLGSWAGRAQEGIGKIESGGVRRMLTLTGVTPGLRKVAAVSRERVGRAEKDIKEMTAREIKRQFAAGGFLTRETDIAAARRLQEIGDLGKEEGIEGYNPEMLSRVVENTWAQGGEWMAFAKVLPQLAKNKYLEGRVSEEDLRKLGEEFEQKIGRAATGDELAMFYMWKSRIRPADMPKMDYSTTFDDSTSTSDGRTIGDLNKRMYLATASGDFHSQFARTNPAKAQTVIGYLKTEYEKGGEARENVNRITRNWKKGQWAYARTNTARELGLSGLFSPEAERPPEVVEEENLRAEADTLKVDVRQKERDLEQLERLVQREGELNDRATALERELARVTDARERVRLQNEVNRIRNVDFAVITRQKDIVRGRAGVGPSADLDARLRQGLKETRDKLRERRERLRNLGATYGGNSEF